MKIRFKVFVSIIVVAAAGVLAYFHFINSVSAMIMVDTTRYLTGAVIDSQTNQSVSNALVKLVYTNYFPTEEDCQQDYESIAPPDDYYCVAGENPYLKLYTDENGNFSSGNFTQFINMPESDYDFIINVSADGYTAQDADYLYSEAVDCDVSEDCDYKVVVNFSLDPIAAERTPIVIVPGILGSYLFNYDGYEVWPNVPLMAISKDDAYLNELILDTDGMSGNDSAVSQIQAMDVIEELYGHDFFGGLIDELKNSGYIEGKDLFVAPYDWRLDVDISSVALSKIINDVQIQTGAGKVDIIAHSLGGLVAKRYIQKYGQDNVDKFIDIATPHYGSPKAFKILSYGDNLDIGVAGFYILNPSTIQIISQNMPAIYQLLPSQNYFDSTDSNYNSYITDVYDVDQNNVKGNLNYDESMDLMKNTGRNEYLLAKNDELHNEIDNFDPAVYGVKAYNIVGCNQPTIGKTYILNKEKNGYEYGLKYISGDSTVPLKSAEGLNNAVHTYYATGAEHSALPSHAGVKELVTAIANNQENNFDYFQYSNISQNDSACVLNGWEVSYHSPIKLHIYDENNNHLGPNQDGDIEMGIAGASYDIIDGNKFAFLPKGHTYRIVGQATDSGTFNARVQNIQNGETTEMQYFNQVPLNSTDTNVEYNLNDRTTNVSINIDEDGDQVFEQTIEPSAILNQTESQDAAKPQTAMTINGTVGQNNWYTSTATIILTGQDEESGSGVLKTEYTLDNGTTWQMYVEPIVLEADGVYNISYKSTDRAGNVETPKEIAVNIDQINPAPNVFSPLSNSEYFRSESINLVYDVMDAISGVATDTIKIFIDNTELNTSSIKLFDYSLGAHTISVSAQDLAGNFTSTTIGFNITADIDSTISDVNTLYASGAINDKANKQLANSLKLIKMQIEKFGQKKIIVDTKYHEAINKCVPKKGNKWCNSKLQPRINRVFFSLNKIRNKIIIIQYQLILAELKQFNKKSLVNLQAYNILTEDINYLINELK